MNTRKCSSALEPQPLTAGRKPLAALVAACSIGLSPIAAAQQLEEVIVTSTKRAESMQDIPMAVSVLDGQMLDDLAVTDIEDYVTMLPNVSFINTGPGTANVYIRGISSGGESSIGASASVAIYLDEQPVTSVSQYLNPHIYDVARIEVLAGPQGTLFGANAQSGAMRIITNKPDPSEFSAGIDIDGNQPTSGDFGHTTEGFVNIPITDRAALRLVAYHKRDPGYIDNIRGEHTFSHARIRDGLMAGGATQAQADAMAPDFTFDNYTPGDISNVAEENFNEATTVGMRAALRVDINDAWTATATLMHQDLESDGVWDHDPTLGDLKVFRILPDELDDKWTQWAINVEGEIAGGTLAINYADLDREQDFAVDYSLYSDLNANPDGFVAAFYSCYAAFYGCWDPRTVWSNDGSNKKKTLEVRYSSNPENRFRWQLGYYDTDEDDTNDGEWHVLGLADQAAATGNPLAVDGPDIYWTTDFQRRYDEQAIFGEVAFDITDTVTIAASARSFDAESVLDGFSGTVWWPCGGTPNYLAQEASGNPRPENNYGAECADEDRVTKAEDEVYRVSLEWAITDDVLLYGTWGEGYRPGGLNRFCSTGTATDNGGQGREDTTGAQCDFLPDFLTSMEIGVKSTLMDGRLRLNAAAFMQDWDDFQFSRLDVSISPTTLTFNIGQAKSDGVEGDFSFLVTDNWTLNGAVSFINAELSEDYFVSATDTVPTAVSGTRLPRVPEFKGNLSTRYHFENDWYVQAAYIYTGSSFNNLFDGGAVNTRLRKQDSYQIVNLATGVQKDSWRAELYVRNATDERGDVFRNAVSYGERVTVNRPRTIGVRLGYSF